MPASDLPPPTPRGPAMAANPFDPSNSYERPPRPDRTRLYVIVGVAAAVLLIGGTVVAVVTDDDQPSLGTGDLSVVTDTDNGEADPVSSDTAPPVTVPTTSDIATTVPATLSTMVPGTAVPPELLDVVDVVDATGTFAVQLPASFQANVDPIALHGVDMSQVSGATDIGAYLDGDFTILGMTVLTGPSDQISSPGALLAQFDPGPACSLSDSQADVATTHGVATMLSYDFCGGANTMILIAIDVPARQRVLFLGMQGAGRADGFARTLVLRTFDSIRWI